MDNINIFLSKTESMRNGYLKMLDRADLDFKGKWLKHFGFLPNFFKEIYSVCNGTKPEINEQVFFDFIPGFRLMQVDEIIEKYEKEFINNIEFKIIIPFLADYASNYYAYAIKSDIGCIVLVEDDEIEIIHYDISSFWKTIIAFYDEDVNYLDEDGYLSYDFEKECYVGRKYNSEIDYWK